MVTRKIPANQGSEEGFTFLKSLDQMDTSNSGRLQAAEDSHLAHFLLLSSNRPAVRWGF